MCISMNKFDIIEAGMVIYEYEDAIGNAEKIIHVSVGKVPQNKSLFEHFLNRISH